MTTRLSSIESQPKKVIVVVVVVVVVVIIFGTKKLILKFGQNWVNSKGYIVVDVFVVLLSKPQPNLNLNTTVGFDMKMTLQTPPTPTHWALEHREVTLKS